MYAISHLANVLLMSLVRNALSSLLTWNLCHYELAIVSIRNDERELVCGTIVAYDRHSRI